MFAENGTTRISIQQSVIHDVRTGLFFFHSLHPIYIDHNNFYNIHGPFPQASSIQFHSVTTGTSGTKIMCNLSDMQGMTNPGVEDHFNMWSSKGLLGANRTEVAYNRIR